MSREGGSFVKFDESICLLLLIVVVGVIRYVLLLSSHMSAQSSILLGIMINLGMNEIETQYDLQNE